MPALRAKAKELWALFNQYHRRHFGRVCFCHLRMAAQPCFLIYQLLKSYTVLHAHLGGEGRRTGNGGLHEVCVLEKFESMIVMVCSLSLSLSPPPTPSLPWPPFPPSSTVFLLQPLKTISRVLTLSAKDEPLWLPLRPPNSREQQALLIPKPLQGSRYPHRFLTRDTL